jgi:hypothetical protein
MTEDRERGRPNSVWCQLVPNGENAPHHILVDGNTEGQGHLLSNPWTPPSSRIPPFHVDDGGHKNSRGVMLIGLLASRHITDYLCEELRRVANAGNRFGLLIRCSRLI